MRAMPSIAWWTPSPLRRQSRRIFQVFMRAKTWLHAGPDLLVGCVVCFLPVGKVFALAAAVGHDESGAGIAAVSDRGGLADGSFGAGFLPRLAVVAVSGQGPTDHDHESGVGVDDDLVVRGVPVVLGLRGDGVGAGGHQGAVHDEHGVLGEPFTGLERENRPEVVNDAADRGLGNPEQRRQLAQSQVRAPTGGDQQHTILQRQVPGPALAHWVRTFAPQRGDEPAELTRAQPGERDYPGRLRRRDHTSHCEMVTRASQVLACGIQEGARCGSTALSRHSRSSALSSPSGRLSSSSNARSSEACVANAALHHSRSG